MEIHLHPQAKDLLFKHYRALSRIFRDVLGQLGIDYISIAFLTDNNELIFFSSKPSNEWNIIENNSWKLDTRFNYDFFLEKKLQIWSNTPLMKRFSTGLSVYSTFNNNRVIYSYASTSSDLNTQNNIMNNVAVLIRMGRYCLINIEKEIPEYFKPTNDNIAPYLKLIVNK